VHVIVLKIRYIVLCFMSDGPHSSHFTSTAGKRPGEPTSDSGSDAEEFCDTSDISHLQVDGDRLFDPIKSRTSLMFNCNYVHSAKTIRQEEEEGN